MIDEQRVREIIVLIGVCVLGAFVLSAIVFIITLSEPQSSPAPNSDATSTVW
jgi:hypothetical protein